MPLVSLYLNNQFLGSHILTGYKFGNTQSNGVLFYINITAA